MSELLMMHVIHMYMDMAGLNNTSLQVFLTKTAKQLGSKTIPLVLIKLGVVVVSVLLAHCVVVVSTCTVAPPAQPPLQLPDHSQTYYVAFLPSF